MVQAGQATANHGWQWLHGQSMVCHGQVIKSKNQGHKLWSTRMVTMQCQPWFSETGGGGGGGGGSFLCKLYHVPNIIIGNGREYSSCYINYYNLKGGEGGGEWSIKGEVI